MFFNINGFDILKKMRVNNIDIFVFILIVKEILDDKVEVFIIGVNDYLIKFFYMEELVVRVYVILRINGKIKERNGLEFKFLYLDILEKRVYIEKEEIKF